MASNIKVQCVSCKATKVLTFAEAKLGQPFCDKCGGPMVAVEARN